MTHVEHLKSESNLKGSNFRKYSSFSPRTLQHHLANMSHNVPAIEKFEGEMITEEMVAAAAKLFSQNYGVWGPMAAEKIGPFAKPGE
jgi:hypothetical protein